MRLVKVLSTLRSIVDKWRGNGLNLSCKRCSPEPDHMLAL